MAVLGYLIHVMMYLCQNKQADDFIKRAVCEKTNQRTNGPVNAHLRSVVYTNKHV